MKHAVRIMVVAIFTIGSISIAVRPSAAADAEPPIRVSQLLINRPIGLLGRRLGERLVIEGILAERVWLANPLKIIKADGRVLKEVVSIELTGDVAPQIKTKVTYKLEGYESGGFSGPPDWLSPQVQQPFQYRPSFVVTRVIEPTTR